MEYKNSKMVTLRQLAYFCALARERHFGKAAAAAGVTQAALSVQIAMLESVLPAPLLIRGGNKPNGHRGSGNSSGRGVRLTKAGALLLKRAQLILSLTETLAADIAAAGSADFDAGRQSSFVRAEESGYAAAREEARRSAAALLRFLGIEAAAAGAADTSGGKK